MAKEKKGNPYARELWRMFKLRNNGICPFCKKEIAALGFKDIESKKENHLSGLCQVCQDDFFGLVEG